MSDELKEVFCNVLRILEVIARKTSNPVDDIIVKALKTLIGCE